MTLTALGLAIAMGFGMGLLGGGGSIVAVPALTFLLHFPPKDAVATSLAVVGLAAAAGALGSFVRGVLPLSRRTWVDSAAWYLESGRLSSPAVEVTVTVGGPTRSDRSPARAAVPGPPQP